MSSSPTSPAETYEQYFVPSNFARWVPLHIEHAAPQAGDRVLDVACGTGIVARSVAPLVGPQGRVVALDLSPDMLAVARTLPSPDGPPIEWREGDAVSLPDGPFDVVFCQQGLQFVDDKAAAVGEMTRVLAPGGRIVASVWQDLERQPVYAPMLEAEARFLGVEVSEVAGRAFSLGDPHELHALFEAEAESDLARVEVVQAERTVRFPSPERFVAMTVMAAGAVVPRFAELDEAERAELVDSVVREIEPVLQRHTDGDAVAFTLHANLAIATRRGSG
jgi:ubiquinone/menaquinone biosynthesis C-methylase UbiE